MPIKLDGPIVTGTRRNLELGVRSSKMTPEAVAAVFSQTASISQRLCNLYGTEIADGEVGEAGSARATTAPITGSRRPRALLYGRVQSGKTVSMILTAALCLDNGFRVVVVLTTDNVALVKQTAGRFKDLSGPRVFAGVKEAGTYEWQGQEDEIRDTIPKSGLVLVCAKNSVNLPEVIRFLQQMKANHYPVLVLDDEADAATPDTTIAARVTGRPNAPSRPSRMYRLVIENEDPGELGFSLGQILPHSLYVQVTATPYVLYLQTEQALLRPSDTFLLEPGSGYCGGEAFFAKFDPETPDAEIPKTIVLVGATESAQVKRAAPEGLLKSVDFFLLAACSLSIKKAWPKDGFKHLSHTSHRKNEHKIVAGYITGRLNRIRQVLQGPQADAEAFFQPAYDELMRSVRDVSPLSEVLSVCRDAIQQAEVYIINSEADAPVYGPRLDFLVGGNILGRGLTIADLLVTYYVREAKVSQMDTVWQHARMFGYRESYLEHCRVYLPPQLAARFRQLNDGEGALRQGVRDGNPTTVLIRLPSASRATRPNALDPTAIRGVRAGREQVNPQKFKPDAHAAAKVLKLLKKAGVPIEEARQENRPRKVAEATAIDLIRTIPIAADDAGIWDPDLVTALVKSYERIANEGVNVYVRELDASAAANDRTRGRLSGPEIRFLRSASSDVPSLAFLFVGDPAAPSGWYPTVVMPEGSPAFVFSGE